MIRVLELAPPLPIAHERAALGYAGRKLVAQKFLEVAAGDVVLGGIVAALADAVEVHAKRVRRWLDADAAVPAVVMPRYSDIEVVDHGPTLRRVLGTAGLYV